MPIRIETEWVDAEAIRGPELSATWASLSIRVDDAVITRLVDRTDTVRSRVYVPLYPLAETLMRDRNWIWTVTPLPTTEDLAMALGEEPRDLARVTRAMDFGVADLVNGVVTQDENGRPACCS